MSVRTQRNSIPLMCFNFKKSLLEDGWYEFWRDDFLDDGLIEPEWAKQNTDADRTFEPSGGVMKVGIDQVRAYLWYKSIRAPMLHFPYASEIVGKPVRITAKLDPYSIVNDTHVGLFIGSSEYIDNKLWVAFENLNTVPVDGETITDVNGAQGTVMAGTYYEAIPGSAGYFCLENKTANFWHGGGGWCSGSIGGANMFVGRNDTLVEHGHIFAFGMEFGGGGTTSLRLRRNNGAYDRDSDDTLPVWLQIRISAGGTVTFWYDSDGIGPYTQYLHGGNPFSINLSAIKGYDSDSPTRGLVLGLIASQHTPGQTLLAPFDFFKIEVYEAQNPTFERCYAPIDARAPETFYDGRIKRMSSLKRAINDETGLFQIADMNVTLANADKEFSSLMASNILKNQEVTLYHHWTEESETLKEHIITMIVEDHSMKGPDFDIKLKDITQKYFTIKVPTDICTVDEFPNLHPDHEGWFMPEILGNVSLLSPHELPGAVQAVYVNTLGAGTRDYLAARGWLRSAIDDANYQVYEEGQVGAVAATMTAHTDGHSYINYSPVDADARVSFNCYGYSIPVWDSGNNCIQNLAYIIQYFLRFMMGIPASLIDAPSFATLAAYYASEGVDKNFYLIIQRQEDGMEILRQLLFTGGATDFMAKSGKFEVGRKNICNWQITPGGPSHIFEQIELFGSPHRQWNLTSAINTIEAQFGYIPWQGLFTGAKDEYRDNRYERPMGGHITIPRPRL